MTGVQTCALPIYNGGASRAWVAGPQVWAQVTPLRMERRFAAAREEMTITHHVVFRFREDVDVACRFRDGARIFRVRALEDADARRTWLRALCEEIRS